MPACFIPPGPSMRQVALAVGFSGTLLTSANAWAEPVVQGIPAETPVTAIDQDAIASAAVGHEYAFTPQTSVSLNLNNVLDENYYTAIGSRSWYGTPCSATATLVYAF